LEGWRVVGRMETDPRKPSGNADDSGHLLTTSSVAVAEQSILEVALSASDAALVKRWLILIIVIMFIF